MCPRQGGAGTSGKVPDALGAGECKRGKGTEVCCRDVRESRGRAVRHVVACKPIGTPEATRLGVRRCRRCSGMGCCVRIPRGIKRDAGGAVARGT